MWSYQVNTKEIVDGKLYFYVQFINSDNETQNFVELIQTDVAQDDGWFSERVAARLQRLEALTEYANKTEETVKIGQAISSADVVEVEGKATISAEAIARPLPEFKPGLPNIEV